MTQSSFWQTHTETGDFAELCNGLYQREIGLIAKADYVSVPAVQARLKSLPYYINRTAHAMTQVESQGTSPMQLDSLNASWSAKQSKNSPIVGQETAQERDMVFAWYRQEYICVGLVVPVLLDEHIIIDCIDRIDLDKCRLRTNVGGWFSLTANNVINEGMKADKKLLMPNKKIMISACAGHRWQHNSQQVPIIPSLRELLLSCSINWKNFKKTLAI
ncbi:hypothetical protein [Colwellia psychrerythraea]|uniref:Uncharacterized protein n=1 Tax=Colwellia psychrerythraea TaxID=28229 RepID=A0A099KLT4_COLPS|nr:hypothetical protein [Colwellia psychrerythraea]KGJ90573.1 hypothetical protein GAB14E_3573 [Colwellia psychrerythraea]